MGLDVAEKIAEIGIAHESHLAELATKDELTGIDNRRGFNEAMAAAQAVHKRRGAIYTVVGIDLDGLKPINDKQGHSAGDDALKTMASALQSRARKEDTVARLGGDEFAMLLTQATAEQASHILGEIRESLQESSKLTFSGGIAQVGDDETVQAAFNRADEAQTLAKQRKDAIEVSSRSELLA